MLGSGLTYEGQADPLTHQAPKWPPPFWRSAKERYRSFCRMPLSRMGCGDGAAVPTSQPTGGGRRKSSLRIASSEDSALVQDVPYESGTYVAKVSAMGAENFKTGKIQLVLTAMNDAGTQIGITLPTAEVKLHAGKWSTPCPAIFLGKISLVPTILKVEVRFEGLSDKDVVYLDDLACTGWMRRAKARGAAGPDGN